MRSRRGVQRHLACVITDRDMLAGDVVRLLTEKQEAAEQLEAALGRCFAQASEP